MAEIKVGGNPVHTVGELPATGEPAPAFTVVKGDLSSVSLSDFAGQRVVLNIFPSIDTPTCAASVRRFNQAAANLDNTTVLNISMDLPFAQARFCGAEGLFARAATARWPHSGRAPTCGAGASGRSGRPSTASGAGSSRLSRRCRTRSRPTRPTPGRRRSPGSR